MKDTVPKGVWCQRLVKVVEERKESWRVEEDSYIAPKDPYGPAPTLSTR